MIRTRVAVIGGGIAGFSASYTLLLENEQFIWVNPLVHKECTSLLTEESISWFKRQGLDDILEQAKVQEEKIDLIYYDKENDTIVIKKPKYLANIDKQKLENMLWNMIPTSNIVRDYAVGIFEKNGLIKILLNSGKIIEAQYVIIATGSNPNFIPEDIKEKRFFTIGINEYYKVNRLPKEAIFILDRKNIRQFYVWIVGKGDTLLIGYPYHARNMAYKIAMQVLKKLGYEDIKIEKLIDRRGAPINFPLYSEAVYLGKNNIIYAGESAGLITLTTGKGIPYALYSGELAAKNYYSIEKYKQEMYPIINKIIKKIEEGKKLYEF